jgi:hypothetical protein
MEISIKVNSLKENQMAMVNITGKTEATSKASSKWEGVKAKVSGRNHREIAINMKDSTFKIKRTVMAFSHGTTATFIKEITSKTRGTAMVRCTGSTVATTRGSGKSESKKDKVILI